MRERGRERGERGERSSG